MSGGMNQQYPPMGGGMGGGPPMITGGPYQGSPQMSRPGFAVGGPDDPAMGGSGYYGGGQGGGTGAVKAVMPRPGMPSGVAGYPSYDPGMFNPGGGMGGGSWNGPAPPGFTHGGGPSTAALEEFRNPTTGETWTASHGGYRPPPGWERVGGSGFSARPTQPGGGMQGGFGNWAGLGQGFSQDQFWKAKSFADRGKMGRAKQAIMQGGGQWSPQLRGLLSSPSGRWGNMGWNTMA
jgi:hypothetical protein